MLAGAPGAIEAVLKFAGRSEGRLMSAYAAHAAARRDRDAEALLTVAETFLEIGAPPYAAEAAVEAAGVFAAAGNTDAARRAAARARELHVPGEGVELPHVSGLESVVIELTARESQLVELVRSGLSNAEIADRLVLSVRTVESHLYRAMQKLGVSDRREL
jgi:DNA-binding NarL/FixJ family response regulator